MDDNLKTREHLLEELDTLREKIAQLEQSHSVRIQAEEALLQSEKRFHLLMEHAADALFIIATDGKIIEVNHMACESLGYTRQELLSMHAWDFGEASDPKLQEEYIRTLPPGDTATIDGMHKRKDGGRFPVEVRLGALEVAGERFTLALARNVTERKLAEEGLRQSEERYRKIFDNSNDAIFLIDPVRDAIADVNDKACEMLGYSREELLSMRVSDIHPHEMPQLRAFAQTVLRDGAGWTNELTCLTKRGDVLASEMSASSFDLDGRPLMIALVRDITERKQAKDELESLAEIGRLVSSTLEIDEIYPRFAEQIRNLMPFDRITISEFDVEAKTLTPFYVAGLQVEGWEEGRTHPLSASRLEPVAYERASLLFDGKSTEEHARQFPDIAAGAQSGLLSGIAVPLISRGRVIGALNLSAFDPDAYTEKDLRLAERVALQISGAIANARLYAAHLRAEEAEREMAVLEERNRIARDIHDSIAQGLTGIIWQLNALERVNQDGDNIPSELIERIRELAKDSLQETRRSVWDLRTGPLNGVPLSQALRREAEKVSGERGQRISVIISGDERVLPSGVENAILRICQEALANAMKYAEATDVTVALDYEESSVKLAVQDNGSGFDPNVQPASRSEGGGFGLISMRERVNLLGGKFTINSSPGQGTLIKAILPLR